MVCNFFGLDFSYTAFSQGYLVRINNDSVVLSDAKLIDAASNLINRYLREYNQSINPAPDTTTPTSPPTEPDESNTTNVSTYLAFLCKDGHGLDQILSALDSAGNQALFFFTPEALEQEDDLVRRILGTGHSVGILADGGTLDQTRALLEEGNRALEHLAYTRTTVAYVPDGQRELLEQINASGIGPQGFGGQTTCLGLAVETAPTHVAGLPVAVNVSCHVTRRASAEL